MNITLSNVVASIPDDRDYIYVPLQGPFPDKSDLMPDVYEVEDQGQVGSCTCNSSISACEMLWKRQHPSVHLSRLFPYWTTRNTVENRPGGYGASLRDALRALNHFGTPLESLWPYVESKADVQPDAPAYADAVNRKITRYERIKVPSDARPDRIITMEAVRAFDFAVKSALYEGLGVVIAARIGTDVKTLTGPWQSHKMRIVEDTMRTGNINLGGHALFLMGDDSTIINPCPTLMGNGSDLMMGSWGKKFADGGFHGWPKMALANDIMECWVVRGFADVMVSPVPVVPYLHQPAEVLRRFWELYRRDVTDPMAPSIQHYAHDPLFPTSFWNDYERIVMAKLAELRASI